MRNPGLTARFEAARPHLRAVAYRMLGSVDDADDAVQDAWLRLSRNDEHIDNVDAWFTTVVARICLNMLRARHGVSPIEGNSRGSGAASSKVRVVKPYRGVHHCGMSHRSAAVRGKGAPALQIKRRRSEPANIERLRVGIAPRACASRFAHDPDRAAVPDGVLHVGTMQRESHAARGRVDEN